jgi:hypothetical protein
MCSQPPLGGLASGEHSSMSEGKINFKDIFTRKKWEKYKKFQMKINKINFISKQYIILNRNLRTTAGPERVGSRRSTGTGPGPGR